MVITRKKKRGGHHLFKRLGVSRKATKRQIKKAYEYILYNALIPSSFLPKTTTL